MNNSSSRPSRPFTKRSPERRPYAGAARSGSPRTSAPRTGGARTYTPRSGGSSTYTPRTGGGARTYTPRTDARPSESRPNHYYLNNGAQGAAAAPRSSEGSAPRRRSFSGGGFSGGRPQGGRSFDRRGSGGGSRGGNRRPVSSFNVSRYINLNPVSTEPVAVYEPKHTFNDFGLTKELEDSIAAMGIKIPSPIQDQTIPLILEGKDVVGLAETGTGKTAAFLIPIINKTLKERGRTTLILTPTRELAIQIEQELRKLTPKMNLYATVCVGGINIRPQISGLKRRNHFIIGTPGRVMDLTERGHIKPGVFTTVIFDEADRMLDMGFIHDMRKIMKDIPDERETLFFSATMSKEITGLVHEFLKDPVTVSVKKTEVASAITQDVIFYEHHNKFDTLVETLKGTSFTRVIIFGAMKHSVEKLSLELVKAGIKSDSIHGNKSHNQRQRALKSFKDGYVRVLVATDVAARGIHVDDVSHVINYDLPNTQEDYVHRIGRTGRSDKRGMALTFVPKKA